MALVSFKQAALLMNVQAKTQKIIFGQFWGAHQASFFFVLSKNLLNQIFFLQLTTGTVYGRQNDFIFIFLFQRFFKYLAIAAKVDYAVCV